MNRATVQKQLNGKYTITREIGQGGYGTVFCAMSLQLEKTVAIKCVQMYLQDEDQTLSTGVCVTVLRESAALRMLRHPGVVELIDIVIGEGVVFYAMEMCDGGDLCDLVYDMRKRGLETMPWDTLRLFTTQLVDALAYVHSCRLAHRDIKPSNVLLKNAHTLRLCDFGMSRTVKTSCLPAEHRVSYDTDYRYTRGCATLGYRPPELLMAFVIGYDPLCVDRWSLGCVIAEMIMLRPLVCNVSESSSLSHIFELFGTPTETTWPGVSPFMPVVSKIWPPTSVQQYFGAVRSQVPPDVAAVADGMLRVNPSVRMTPSSAVRLMRKNE